MAAVEVVMENPSGGPNHKTPTSGGVSISRRSKKAVIESDSEDESSLPCGGGLPPLPPLLEGSGSSTINYSMDISQLEAPTFTTLERGPSASMTSLAWDHGVNLIGKKVLNPMIHCCDKCLKPILIYGRMIPCKHVFCLKCAQGEKNGSCSRCGDKVSHVDHAGLGSIYMCSHGGSRYGNNGCRRTYLSQRDLQAHIRHRHLKAAAAAALQQQQHEHTRPPSALSSSNHQGPLHPPPPPTNNHSPAPPTMTGPNNNSSGTPTRLLSATAAPPLLKVPPGEVYANPRANPSSSYSSPRTTLHPPLNPAGPPPPTQQQQQLNQPISVISSNRTASNLITVPIIEGESSGANGSGPPGDHYGSSYNYNGAPYYPTHYSHPPPNYPPSPAVVPTDPYYSPHNYESAYNGNTAYRTTNNPSGNPPSSYYRR